MRGPNKLKTQWFVEFFSSSNNILVAVKKLFLPIIRNAYAPPLNNINSIKQPASKELNKKNILTIVRGIGYSIQALNRTINMRFHLFDRKIKIVWIKTIVCILKHMLCSKYSCSRISYNGFINSIFSSNNSFMRNSHEDRLIYNDTNTYNRSERLSQSGIIYTSFSNLDFNQSLLHICGSSA